MFLQETGDRFTISVVVVDNDACRSAEAIVRQFSKDYYPVTYHIEPRQNTALARNKAVDNAEGEFVAFIDDDETPAHHRWILDLLEAIEKYGSDGALGPVKPSYSETPPAWVLKGKFHEKPVHETGLQLKWNQTRTGNALIKRAVFDRLKFRSEFGCDGEDRDFFRRAMEKGYRFVWCNNAPVVENIPKERCSRKFMLRRALMRGRKPGFTIRQIVSSIAAICLYPMLLPVCLLKGQHVWMKYLIKFCDHLGRVLCIMGIDVIKEAYVTEQNNYKQ